MVNGHLALYIILNQTNILKSQDFKYQNYFNAYGPSKIFETFSIFVFIYLITMAYFAMIISTALFLFIKSS